MLAPTLPANTLQGMMQLCCDALVDEGNTFYSQRVFDLFPQMATANSGWATHTAESLNVFGSMIGTDAANDSDYIEWTVFLPAGSYKVSALYYKNTSVGKADLTIDGGSVVDTLDTYGAALARNSLWTSAAFTVTEGSHTIKLTKNGKNASSTGYTIWVQHLFLVKQDSGSALASVANIPHTINVPIVFADSHTNWNTVQMNTAYMFGTRIQSSGAQNATVTYSFWAPKGAYTLALLHGESTNYGICAVSVDGGSIGSIDFYDTSSSNVLNTSLTGTFATTGIHTITFLMSDKNASSSSYFGVLHHIQIRMTSIAEPLAQDLAPEVALLWPQFRESNSGFNTVQFDSGQAYYWELFSSGAQNNEVTMSTNVNLRPGTYRLDGVDQTSNNRGIMHVLVDTVDVGQRDQYSAGLTKNTIGTVSNIALTGYAPHTITLKMASKNASSSSYGGTISLARLIRTGA